MNDINRLSAGVGVFPTVDPKFDFPTWALFVDGRFIADFPMREEAEQEAARIAQDLWLT